MRHFYQGKIWFLRNKFISLYFGSKTEFPQDAVLTLWPVRKVRCCTDSVTCTQDDLKSVSCTHWQFLSWCHRVGAAPRNTTLTGLMSQVTFLDTSKADMHYGSVLDSPGNAAKPAGVLQSLHTSAGVSHSLPTSVGKTSAKRQTNHLVLSKAHTTPSFSSNSATSGIFNLATTTVNVNTSLLPVTPSSMSTGNISASKHHPAENQNRNRNFWKYAQETFQQCNSLQLYGTSQAATS